MEAGLLPQADKNNNAEAEPWLHERNLSLRLHTER